jgi:hypothetical protein
MARRAELGAAYDRLHMHGGRGEGIGEHGLHLFLFLFLFCIFDFSRASYTPDHFQVVKCEREVSFLLKLMAVAGGDIYLTRLVHHNSLLMTCDV